jgi:hypothetical protein
MDCKIIIFEGEEKVLWWGALIVVNVLKFNRNQVDRPTIFQSVRMERLYSQDSKSMGLIRSKCHLDFHRKYFLQGGTLRKLLLHRILSKIKGKIFFFKWKSKW